MTNSENKVDPMLVQEMLEKFGLDWYVKKEPMLLNNNGELEETPYFATVRQDNRRTFASVKEGYEIFQNHELAELVHRVAGTMGHKVTNGGKFNGGGQVYLQIALEDQKVANDRIQRWASGINSFDGSTSLRWSPETNTISCSNTFWAAYRTMRNSVRHTSNMRQMVEQSLKAIGELQHFDHSVFEVFNRLAETDMRKEHIVSVVEAVTDVDMSKDPTVLVEKHSTRALNKAQDLMESITGEVNDKGRTLWGLWSGLTHYTTHKAGTDKNREKSKAIGSLAQVDNTVFEMMKQLVYA